MVNDENSAPLLLGKFDERTELPSYLVCRVDPRFLSDICRQRVKDDELGVRFADSLQQTLVGKAQVFFLLADEDQSVRVASCLDKAGHDGIVCIVLRGLVDDIDRLLTAAIRERHRLAPAEHCGEVQHKGAFPVTGIALQDRYLAVGDIRIP